MDVKSKMKGLTAKAKEKMENKNIPSLFTTVDSTQAPPNSHDLLDKQNGIILKQDPKWIEAFLKILFPCTYACCSCCFDLDPLYRIGALPEDKQAIKEIGDPNGWKPSLSELRATPKTFLSDMQSNLTAEICLSICCCSKAAPHSITLKHKTYTWPYISYRKKLACGAAYCCPHTAYITRDKVVIGRVKQDWTLSEYPRRCFESKVLCTDQYKIQQKENNKWVDKYSILVGQTCIGPHVNCCGATPLRNDMLWEIKTPSEEIVARIQKTYGGTGSMEGFVRWLCLNADNYVMDWNEDTTLDDKVLFITTTVFLETILFGTTNPISRLL